MSFNVEPMQQGSSPNSPPINRMNFLPSYLLGRTGAGGGTTCGTPMRQQSLLDSPSAHLSPADWTHSSVAKTVSTTPRERTFGPPTASFATDGLYDSSTSVETSRASGSRADMTSPPKEEKFSTPTKPVSSIAQVDPFYSQGENFDPHADLDDACITVFGFPKNSASFILQQFGQYGGIVHYEISTKGNWMHIKYQTRLQATTALSKNTKIFADSIQIGVTPCIDKTFVRRTRELAQQSSTALDPFASPARSSTVAFLSTPQTPTTAFIASAQPAPVQSPQSPFNMSGGDSLLRMSGAKPPKMNMRSLTGAASGPIDVTNQAAMTPDRLSKAMGYIFSW